MSQIVRCDDCKRHVGTSWAPGESPSPEDPQIEGHTEDCPIALLELPS